MVEVERGTMARKEVNGRRWRSSRGRGKEGDRRRAMSNKEKTEPSINTAFSLRSRGCC